MVTRKRSRTKDTASSGAEESSGGEEHSTPAAAAARSSTTPGDIKSAPTGPDQAVGAVRRSGTPSSSSGLIRTPRYRDVLLGRGRGIQTSNGNFLMREITRKHRDTYCALPRAKRRQYSEAVLDEILATGSRFLRHVDDEDDDQDTSRGNREDCWVEVDRTTAHDKVSHSLREKGAESQRGQQGGMPAALVGYQHQPAMFASGPTSVLSAAAAGRAAAAPQTRMTAAAVAGAASGVSSRANTAARTMSNSTHMIGDNAGGVVAAAAQQQHFYYTMLLNQLQQQQQQQQQQGGVVTSSLNVNLNDLGTTTGAGSGGASSAPNAQQMFEGAGAAAAGTTGASSILRNNPRHYFSSPSGAAAWQQQPEREQQLLTSNAAARMLLPPRQGLHITDFSSSSSSSAGWINNLGLEIPIRRLMGIHQQSTVSGSTATSSFQTPSPPSATTTQSTGGGGVVQQRGLQAVASNGNGGGGESITRAVVPTAAGAAGAIFSTPEDPNRPHQQHLLDPSSWAALLLGMNSHQSSVLAGTVTAATSLNNPGSIAGSWSSQHPSAILQEQLQTRTLQLTAGRGVAAEGAPAVLVPAQVTAGGPFDIQQLPPQLDASSWAMLLGSYNNQSWVPPSSAAVSTNNYHSVVSNSAAGSGGSTNGATVTRGTTNRGGQQQQQEEARPPAAASARSPPPAPPAAGVQYQQQSRATTSTSSSGVVPQLVVQGIQNADYANSVLQLLLAAYAPPSAAGPLNGSNTNTSSNHEESADTYFAPGDADGSRGGGGQESPSG